jgi:hypothetical protein
MKFMPDHTVVKIIYTRSWSLLTGIFIVFLVTTRQTPEEQGYYYLLLSAASLQVFIEMGLTTVIQQHVGHQYANLRWDNKSRFIKGPASQRNYIRGILKNAIKWFGVGGTLGSITLFFMGVLYFKYLIANDQISPFLNLVWAIISLSILMNLLLAPYFAVMEGLGKIDSISTIRLIQSKLYSITLIIGLVMNLGIISLGLAMVISSLAGAFLLYRRHKYVLFQFSKFFGVGAKKNSSVSIYEFQSKIAVSWLCGYVIFQGPVITAGIELDAAGAGRVGLTLQMLNVVSSMAMTWIAAKAPAMATFRGANQKNKLNQMFRTQSIRSIFFFVTCLLGFFLIYVLAAYKEISYIERFESANHFFIYGLASFFNTIVFGFAIYLRSNLDEPLMWVSLAHCLVSIFGYGLVLNGFPAIGIPLTFLIGATLSFGMSWIIFKEEYKKN